jgi:AcrR family transcriptional regulator
VQPEPATRAQRIKAASARRREERRLETRQAILEAATSLFAREGYEAFSLRRVAESIGYSPAAIYLHFEDKDDLLVEVLVNGYQTFNRTMEAAIAGITDPLEQLHALGMTYIAFGMERPVYFKAMFMGQSDFLSTAPPDRIAFFTDVIQLMHRVIADCATAGRIRPIDPAVGFAMLWALAHGQVALAICFQKPASVLLPEAERALRVFEAGLSVTSGD